MMIRPPPPQVIALGLGSIGKANRATSSAAAAAAAAAAVTLSNNTVRHLSTSPRSNHANNNDTEEPWWSLSSLHKRIATAIATTLPEESLSAVHKSLSEKLGEADSHKSVSIGEAIVSARAREASLQSSTINSNNNNNNHGMSVEKQKQLETEMEQRAFQKAQERMQLELQAMKEQWKKKDAQRVQREKEEREKMEWERNREVAFEKWQANAERERRREEERENGQQTNGARAVEVEGAHGIMQQTAERESTMQAEREHHPILGPQIAHLPYKRIHLTPASTLASLPVYEKQRAYRHDRAQVMAKDKKKTLWMGIPGVISLLEEDDGRLSILDGQHRVGMMALLEEEQRKLSEKADNKGIVNGSSSSSSSGRISGTHEEQLAQLDLNSVLVEVFFPRQSDNNANSNNDIAQQHQHQTSANERNDKAATIFTEINKAEPVKLLDLPGMATKRTLSIIDHAASHYHNAFPAMFSSSQKCRAPNLNLDNLRDTLFASEVIQREKMGSGGELVRWMEDRNKELRERYGEESSGDDVDVTALEGGGGKRVSAAALKKARKHGFYLGLESTWLYK